MSMPAFLYFANEFENKHPELEVCQRRRRARLEIAVSYQARKQAYENYKRNNTKLSNQRLNEANEADAEVVKRIAEQREDDDVAFATAALEYALKLVAEVVAEKNASGFFGMYFYGVKAKLKAALKKAESDLYWAEHEVVTTKAHAIKCKLQRQEIAETARIEALKPENIRIAEAEEKAQAMRAAHLAKQAAHRATMAAQAHEQCLAFYGYNPDTGTFTAGGSFDRNGYLMLPKHPSLQYVDGFEATKVSGHRIAVYLMTGKAPPKGMVVDHLRGTRADNSWKNLQVKTHTENSANRSNVEGENRRPGLLFSSVTQLRATSGTYRFTLHRNGRSQDYYFYEDATLAGEVRAAAKYDLALLEFCGIVFDPTIHHSNKY